MEEILHQLKTMVYPIMYRVSTIRLVVHDFATIHSIINYLLSNECSPNQGLQDNDLVQSGWIAAIQI